VWYYRLGADPIVRLLAVATVLAVLVGLAPTAAWAQAGWYLIPSFSLTESFDDNIFSTSSGREWDFISRFSPGLQAGYRSEPFTLFVSGGFDAEVFARNPVEDDATSGKHGGLSLRYLPVRPLTLGLDVGYTETRSLTTLLPALVAPVTVPTTTTTTSTATPAGTPPPTTTPTSPTQPPATTGPTPAPSPAAPVLVNALEFGRSRATVLTVSPSAAYQFTPLTAGTFGYTYSHATLEGGAPDTAHSVSLGLSHQFTPLDTGRLGYRLDVFESPGTPTTTTHAPTVGWTRQLTPTLTFSFDGGPRFSSEGGVRPEISASLAYLFKVAEIPGQASLAYAHSEGFVIGSAGPVKTETVSGALSFEPLRSLNVSVGPSITKYSGSTTPDTTVYAVFAGASYQILKWLAARASYSYSFQDQSGVHIPHNVFSVGLDASYPYRIGQ
jgi:hypothetical protein